MPSANPVSISINVLKNKRVLKNLAKREIQKTYQGSVFGMLWLFASPLVRLVVYTFVFGVVFGGRFTAKPEAGPFEYALGIFLGLVVFQVIVDGITMGPNVILKNSNLVKKVRFPLEIIPVACASVSGVNLAVGIGLIVIALFVLDIGFSLSQLWFFTVLPPVILLSLGCYWLFSAIGVYFRDVAQATQVLSMLLLFGSAIFYPLTMVPEAARPFFMLNPVVHAVELSRNTVLGGTPPAVASITYLYAVSVAMFSLGYVVFEKLRDGFVDVM